MHDCKQEPRLAVMDQSLAGILETLKRVENLLTTSVKSEERIRVLQKTVGDQEDRIRKLESAQATGKWTERVVWLLVTAGLGCLVKFGGKQ